MTRMGYFTRLSSDYSNQSNHVNTTVVAFLDMTVKIPKLQKIKYIYLRRWR